MSEVRSSSIAGLPRSGAASWFNERLHLAACVGNRDNNFNLLRMIAATLVLFSHAFALSSGDIGDEPLRETLGLTWGVIAVDLFFVSSGFLVTGSLLARGSIAGFARARALRIYPGLAVSVLLTVFALGALATTLPLPAYLSDAQTLEFLLRNLSLVTGIAHALPGVFEGNPMRALVNSSLWTLPYEIGMYAALAGLWLLAGRSPARLARLMALIAVLAIATQIGSHFLWRDSSLLRLGAMFMTGACCHLLRSRITLSVPHGAACLLLLAASCARREAFFVVYTLTLPYLVLCLAYLPRGALRRYNRVGDYSYGIYIYAFPVQQALAWGMPGIGSATMLALSAVLTALAAALSWHLVESRALRLKRA